MENSSNPYNPTYHNGFYQFTTDQQLEYSCSFKDLTNDISPILSMYDITIAEFLFFYENQGDVPNPKHDSRVSVTIQSLLKSFFRDPEQHNVLFYVCDYSDQREKSRNTLFARWYEGFAEGFVKTNVEIDIQDDVTLYGCLLRRDDFPFEEILKSEVIDRAEGFMLGKYGQ